MLRTLMLCGVSAAVLLAAAPNSAVTSQPASRSSPSSCFKSRDWENWKPTPDSRAIYIRVHGHGVFRLDFSTACPAVQWPDAHLVTKEQSTWICSPLDIDLKVADAGGFVAPCIVSKITPLTVAEAKALPRTLQP